MKYLTTISEDYACQMQIFIVKSFLSSIQFELPLALHSKEQMDKWMGIFFDILNTQVDNEGVSYEDDIDKNLHYKLRKYIGNIFIRFLSKCGRHKERALGQANDAFKRLFIENYSKAYLDFCVNQLLLSVEGKTMVPKRLQTIFLNYLTLGVYNSEVWKSMKPNIMNLFTEIVLPLLCFSEGYWTMFTSDPQEYIRIQRDPQKEFYSPRVPAITVLKAVIKYRESDFIVSIQQSLINFLDGIKGDRGNESVAHRKYAAFEVLGALNKNFANHKELHHSIERIIVEHIFPEFSSPFPFLKAKSCWVVGKFSNISFNDPQNFLNGLNHILECCSDPSLPICVEAILALRGWAEKDLSKTVIQPILPYLVNRHFELMHDIDSDDLVLSLQVLIRSYRDDMTSYSVELMKSLASNFLRIVETDEIADDDDSLITAMNTLSAMHTLLKTIREKEDMYEHIEEILLPVVEKVVSSEIAGLVDEVSRILVELTYYASSISPRLWKMYDFLVSCFLDWADDYIGEFFPIFENVISKDSESFLKENRLELVFQMYKKLVGDTNMPEKDCAMICQLVEIIFLNCKGKIDHALSHFIEVTVFRIPECYSNGLKVFLLEVISNAMYYNPTLTLQFLESRNWSTDVFEVLIDFVLEEKFTRIHDKRCIIFGLSSIFQVPFQELPPFFKEKLKDILIILLQLTERCESQKNTEEDDSDGSNSDGDNFESDDQNIPDNQDVFSARRVGDKVLHCLLEDREWDLYRFDTGELPNDDVEESSFLIRSVDYFYQNNPQIGDDLTKSLSIGETNLMNRIVRLTKSKESNID